MAVANAAINVFQTITDTVGLTTVGIYTAPVPYTSVILLAQVTNIGSGTETVTFGFSRNSVVTPIVQDLPIQSNDTANLVVGKLVVETGDTLTMVGSTSTDLKFILSLLETSNI
jgi:hypothetical protein